MTTVPSDKLSEPNIHTEGIIGPENFLEIFRDTAHREQFSFGGPVRKSFAEFDSKYTEEAVVLAEHQSEQLSRRIGDLAINPDTFFEVYKEEFVKSVRFIGRNCIQKQDKYPFLAESFTDDNTREKILLNLARDMRRNFYTLSGVALQRSRLGTEPWRAAKSHINNPQLITEISDQFSRTLGTAFIVKVLKGRSYDSGEFLDYAERKISSIKKDTKYKDISAEIIKKAVAYHKEPEPYLDKVLANLSALPETEKSLPKGMRMQLAVYGNSLANGNDAETIINELSTDPRIVSFGGKSIINKSIRLNPGNPEAVANEIINTFEQLRSSKDFQEIQESHIKRIAISYVTIEKATEVLKIGLNNYQRLKSNRRFTNFFNRQTLLDVALHRKYNPEEFLKKTITRFKRIRNIQRFDIIEDHVIKNILFTSPNKYMQVFEQIARQFKEHTENFNYRFLPRYVIKNVVNKTRLNHNKLLNARLKEHVEFISKNNLNDKFSLLLIRDVFDQKPRSAKRLLAKASKLFDKNLDKVDLTNLSPQFLGYACIHHPKDINNYLDKSRQQILDLFNDPRFESFHVDHVRTAVLEYQDNAESVLLDTAHTIRAVLSDKKLSGLKPQTITKAILDYGPKVGIELLNNLARKKSSNV